MQKVESRAHCSEDQRHPQPDPSGNSHVAPIFYMVLKGEGKKGEGDGDK
jgi:hypothetical protein